jgi:hypothetical protein
MSGRNKLALRKELMMNREMLLSRKLEEQGRADEIMEILEGLKAGIRPDTQLQFPVIKSGRALEQAIRKARLQRRVRPGFEDIADKLTSEKKGLTRMSGKTETVAKERISRLLLFSNDGAQRLYRHIEQLCKQHYPRILACQLDIDGRSLGTLIAGDKGARGSGMKVIIIEHKDAVADILLAVLEDTRSNESGPT